MGVFPAPPGITSSGLKMDNKKRLAYAIIQFLHDQLRHGGLSSDAQESLEGRWVPATSPSPWAAAGTVASCRHLVCRLLVPCLAFWGRKLSPERAGVCPGPHSPRPWEPGPS